MFGWMRAGGFAAAFLLLAGFSAPSVAAEAQVAPVQLSAPALAADLTAGKLNESPAPAVEPLVAAPVQAAPVEAAPVQAAPVPTAQVQPSPSPQLRRPLRDLVISHVDYGNRDAEQDCLVKAIYFEARSESLEGQLAVAEVVLHRASSGIYPPTICGVVTQPAQFSFIRGGRFPVPNTDSEAWRRAVAIADIARKQLADALAPNVLWYHATYVAPSWGRRLTRVAQIGTHIFYS